MFNSLIVKVAYCSEQSVYTALLIFFSFSLFYELNSLKVSEIKKSIQK